MATAVKGRVQGEHPHGSAASLPELRERIDISSTRGR